MPDSGLIGPLALNNATIDAAISRTSPGAYALGAMDGSTFMISYVGRSDDDVKARLKNHVGLYPTFKYGYQPSAKAAFDKECNLFHDFGEYTLANKIHPDRPAGSNWTCPRCKNFG